MGMYASMIPEQVPGYQGIKQVLSVSRLALAVETLEHTFNLVWSGLELPT